MKSSITRDQLQQTNTILAIAERKIANILDVPSIVVNFNIGTREEPRELGITDTFAVVLLEASQVFGISQEEILSSSRKISLVWARQIIIKIMYDRFGAGKGLTLTELARMIGDKHHSTMIHSIEHCNDLIETNHDFRFKYNRMFEALKEGGIL